MHMLPAKQTFIPSHFKDAQSASASIGALIAEIEKLEERLAQMVTDTDHLFNQRLDINDRYVVGRGKGGKPVLGRKSNG